MTVRVVGKCRRCGRVCRRGLTRCHLHPIGRPKARDEYAEAWERRNVLANRSQATTARDDRNKRAA